MFFLRKNKKNNNTIFLTLLLLLLLDYFCVNQLSSEKETDKYLTKKNVGPDGDTIIDINGASLEIPSGALLNNTEISFRSYSSDEIAQKKDKAIFLACCGDFYPSGQIFFKPVTITLPSFSTLTYDTLSCFYLDTINKRWEYVGKAIASRDKKSVKVSVNHFTTFGVFNFPAEFLSEFERFLGNGSNPEEALDAFASWLENTTNIYNQHVVFNNCCYGVSGIFYDVTYKIGDVENTVQKQTGEKTEQVNTFSQREYHSQYQNADGKQIIFSILVTLYLKCSQKMELKSDKTEIKKGESAIVTANFKCGGSAIAGQNVLFSVKGPATLNKDSVLSSVNGSALVKVTANDTGRITITAKYETCLCEECNREMSESIIINAVDTPIQKQWWHIKVSVTSPGIYTKGNSIHCSYKISDFRGNYEFYLITDGKLYPNMYVDSVIANFSVGSIDIDTCNKDCNDSWISEINVNSPKMGRVYIKNGLLDTSKWYFAILSYTTDTIYPIYFKVNCKIIEDDLPDVEPITWSSWEYWSGIFGANIELKLIDGYTSSGKIGIFKLSAPEGTYNLEVRRIK